MSHRELRNKIHYNMVKLKSKGRKFTLFYASFNRIGAKRAGMEKSV